MREISWICPICHASNKDLPGEVHCVNCGLVVKIREGETMLSLSYYVPLERPTGDAEDD
jgi:rubredoxin